MTRGEVHDKKSYFLLGLAPHMRPFGLAERLHLSHHRSFDRRETWYLMNDVDWKRIRYDPAVSIISKPITKTQGLRITEQTKAFSQFLVMTLPDISCCCLTLLRGSSPYSSVFLLAVMLCSFVGPWSLQLALLPHGGCAYVVDVNRS